MSIDAERAKSLFLAASDIADAAERAAYLDRECGGDADLRARVDALLKANDDAPLPESGGADRAGDPGATQVYGDPGSFVGQTIAGRYKLAEEIGEGGMGTVFMAQQTEPVKRLVAVKIVKPGMDSKAVLARFEAERQALALMDHPNIARVLDAGSTESGRPFFVMELVKGIPITQYCDQRRLTPRQRLELFIPVCQAIQHAHQKGIIHRDIKPSNVLVAMYDDRAVPKVIDFGLAKAAWQALTDKTLITGFGALVGTPEYMSPEQANLNNLDIDTRCDVYSLGVLLYELLTGSTPVDRKSLGAAALLEVLRIVREVEAPRPSTKLSSSEALPSIAANRNTEPARLAKLMRGELDWVLLKALEKDRARRYETANGLARDIQRYLSDEVVEARPPSTGYRLWKFVRRHKAQVAAASLVLLALLAGITGTTLGLIRAEQQRRLAEEARYAEKERAEGEQQAKLDAEARRVEAERQKSRAEAGEKLASERLVQVENEKKKVEAEKEKVEEEKQIAQAMRDFLQNKLLGQTDTLTQANALLRAGESSSKAKLNPTIRELLDRAALELAPGKIEASFPNQPLLQAEILQTVGRTYGGVGEYERAIGFLQRSAAQYRQHLGIEHPKTLASMGNLANAYRNSGKLGLALPLLAETLKLMKAHLGPDHPDTLTCTSSLANAHQESGKLDLALPLLEETLKIEKAKLGPDHPSTLISMSNLANAYRESGKLDLALPLCEETLKLMKAKLGPDHPSTLLSMNNLAVTYDAAGKLDLALPLLEETLRIQRAKLGPDHPSTLISMENLAGAYRESGKPDLALPLCAETLKLMQAKLGPDHPFTLASMGNFANAYREAGKPDLAIPLLAETLKLMKAKLGPDHPFTLIAMGNLAHAYHSAGKLEMAIPLYEETLKLVRAKFGSEHPNTLICMRNLAMAYWEAGKLDLALPLLEAAYPAEKRSGLHGVGTALLDVYVRTGKTGKAAALAKELLADARTKVPKASPQLAGQLASIGLSLLQAKVFTEAEPLLRECLFIRAKTQPDEWTTFNTKSMLGSALAGQEKYAEAEPLLLAGYEGMTQREAKVPPSAKVRLTEALERLVQVYEALEKKDEAAKWRKELETRKEAQERLKVDQPRPKTSSGTPGK